MQKVMMASDIAQDFTEQVMNSQFLSPVMFGDTGGNISSSKSSENFASRSRSRSRSRECLLSDQQQPFLHQHQQQYLQYQQLQQQQPKTEDPISDSAYTLACDSSQYSDDVDLWIRSNNTESTGVQGSRVVVVQRSTLAPSSSMDQGIWYLIAVLLPLFSVNNSVQWRCTASNVLGAAEIFLRHLSRFCGNAREQVRRLAQDQIARDLFATAMDIVLVVYAIGFLVLSLYQASIIG
ncbi:unnamed protein product [Chrysodeixis includens]|uniref:Uncharacterized protein n=1 Tax=Chrysodeixis includens TaxID=689277 RepID=A0A9P0BP25_CHRIL|nr:unnamed protein product [Chrysodeixis includens]